MKSIKGDIIAGEGFSDSDKVLVVVLQVNK